MKMDSDLYTEKRELMMNFDNPEPLEIHENEASNGSTLFTPTRRGTFLKEWVFMSSMYFDASEVLDQNTVFSLKHLPSSDRKSNAFLMAVNLQSMICGTTVLGLPFCVKIAGIWSLFAMFIIGVAASFTAVILGDCQYQSSFSKPGESKRVHISFVQMGKICLHQIGSVFMKILVYLSLLRNVIVLILLTDLTKAILAEFNFTDYDTRVLTVLWTFATIPLFFITKVSYLAWVSFIGLKLYICAIIAIFTVTLIKCKSWDPNTISWEFDVEKFGIAIGIIVNSYSIHMNLPALEGSLQDPSHYKQTSKIAFTLNNILKIAFALCGYLTYTETTQQEVIVNVTSYPPLPMILRVAIIFFTYFSIPISSFVAFELLDATFKKKFPALGKLFWVVLSRLLFMMVALLIGVLVPHFGLVVSLVGSIRGCTIMLILPCAFYIMLKTHEVKFYKVLICYTIIGFGFIGGTLGFYASIKALIKGVEF